MNCPQVREQLPELLYGGLTPNVVASLEGHLAGCAACRHELDALKLVRHALDAVPPAAAEVDLPRLYRAAVQVQERRSRRWRRVAFAFAGVAAALALFAILPSLEFRWEAHQFAVRWGAPPPLPQPPQRPAPVQPEVVKERTEFVSTTAPDVEERLGKLSDLVQLLADDADHRDARQRRDLEALRAQLLDLREQSRQWRLSTERDIAALYAVQFPETRKGKQP